MRKQMENSGWPHVRADRRGFLLRGLAAVATGAVLMAAPGCVRPLAEGGSGMPARRTGHLEVRVFQGGYGVDFYERAAREYESMHPGVSIDVQGDPRIWEQLRPRFVAGEPPGLTFPGWGMDHYSLIYEGQALPLDDALLTSPYGTGQGTWRDSFIPDVLRMGEYEGQTYLLPYYVNLNGWWYNANLFEQHGWTPPETYEDLLSLGNKIRAAGIAPLTYQGKYPAYTIQGFLLPWAISRGGIEVYEDAEALKPGAWKHPAFLDAARKVAELRERGFFQSGANSMSHTEAQMEFLQGKAAMIPCGTWLESEMKNQLPAGFRMEFFPPPHFRDGKGDPTALQVGVEPWLIPTRGSNPALAIDFFKYLTSEAKAREFVREKGSLTAVTAANEGDLPQNLQAPVAALKRAGVTWTTNYAQWYKSLDEALKTAMGSLLQGQLTPEQFVDQVEAAADKVRRDPNIPKPQPSR
jgi:N-acetylglucosamine transport system substrate-binding protein